MAKNNSLASSSSMKDIQMQSNVIREVIHDNLDIRCVFPCSLYTTAAIHGVSARCMLEKQEQDLTQANNSNIINMKLQEDMIVRYREDMKLKLNDDQEISLFEGIEENITLLYDEIFIQKKSETKSMKLIPQKKFELKHPGLNPLIDYCEKDEHIVIAQDFMKHSALSVSRFHSKTSLKSPTLGRCGGIGSRDLRLRFIVYQLLQVVAYIHSNNVVLDKLTPANILLDDNMWLTLPFSVSGRSALSALIRKYPQLDRRMAEMIPITKIPRPIDYQVPITYQWIEGRISNFDYIMAVNHAAGRTMVDPLYHPIVPWITDFTEYTPTPAHGLRDLTKTKFRLSKGDAQLETTYKHSDPPHHIPESLSELTYYIYLARRTPLQVLRRVVRDVFVPEHYPSSIHRMYDWSPDECIPEFYLDPSVFESIHHNLGLTDLDLPPFIDTPMDFIRYHRELFESDAVSATLHHWVDLTFGYCLNGSIAVKNMNVPLKNTLSMKDKYMTHHNLEKHPGFIMLFSKPHPRKRVSYRYTARVDKDRDRDRAPEGSEKRQQLRHVDSGYSISGSSKSMSSILPTTSSGSSSKGPKTPLLMTSIVDKNKYHRGDLQAFMNCQVSSIPSVPAYMTSTLKREYEGAAYDIVNCNSLYIAYDNDPTWNILKLSSKMDLPFEKSSRNLTSDLHNYVRFDSFSNDNEALLHPMYDMEGLLPSPEEISSPTAAAAVAATGGGNESKVDKSKNIWDREYAESLLEYALSSSPLPKADDPSVLEYLKGQDLFAVGCIIAELYLGKPLLSYNDLQSFIQSSNPWEQQQQIMHAIYSKNNVAQNSKGVDEYSLDHNHQLPLILCRLVSLLVHPNPSLRPSCEQILQSCSYFNEDTELQCILEHHRPGHIDFMESCTSSCVHSPSASAVNDLLESYCHTLFPSYFRSVYHIIGRLKLHPNSASEKLATLASFLPEILYIPIEGLSLMLPHTLQVLSDSSPFWEICTTCSAPPSLLPGMGYEMDVTSSSFTGHHHHHPQQEETSTASEVDQQLLQEILLTYPNIIDVFGLRLGHELSEKLLIAPVVEFLTSLKSSRYLVALLNSNIWQVLILRCGIQNFLKHFFPLMLTYLSSNLLQNISTGMLTYHDKAGITPLWATMGISDRTEWLHLCKKTEVKLIQEATVTALTNLMEPGTLGQGNMIRFILPCLVSLIGIPQLSIAGYNITNQLPRINEKWTALKGGLIYQDQYSYSNNTSPSAAAVTAAATAANGALSPFRSGAGSSNTATNESGAGEVPSQSSIAAINAAICKQLEEFLSKEVSNDTQDMFLTHTIISISSQLNEFVIIELILSRIFDEVLPALDPLISIPIPAPSTISALMEIILLLNGILPNLSVETISRYYLQSNKSNILKLLITLPITIFWSIQDDIESHRQVCDIQVYIESERRYCLLFELIRLIISVSMIVGTQTCIDYVLPAVDKFFYLFVEAYGNYSVDSRVMLKAFELGAELYIPLENYTGSAFYSCVPSLNPRLEMWLNAVGTGQSCAYKKSPSLPNNILPIEETALVDSGNTQVAPQKKSNRRSIFSNWISGNNNSSSSSGGGNSSNLPAGPTGVSSSTTAGSGSGIPPSGLSTSLKSSTFISSLINTNGPSGKTIPSSTASTGISISSNYTASQHIEYSSSTEQMSGPSIAFNDSSSNSYEYSPVTSNVYAHGGGQSSKKPPIALTPFTHKKASKRRSKPGIPGNLGDSILQAMNTVDSTHSEGMELKSIATRSRVGSSADMMSPLVSRVLDYNDHSNPPPSSSYNDSDYTLEGQSTSLKMGMGMASSVGSERYGGGDDSEGADSGDESSSVRSTNVAAPTTPNVSSKSNQSLHANTPAGTTVGAANSSPSKLFSIATASNRNYSMTPAKFYRNLLSGQHSYSSTHNQSSVPILSSSPHNKYHRSSSNQLPLSKSNSMGGGGGGGISGGGGGIGSSNGGGVMSSTSLVGSNDDYATALGYDVLGDEESIEHYYHDITWLLAGYGKWNVTAQLMAAGNSNLSHSNHGGNSSSSSGSNALSSSGATTAGRRASTVTQTAPNLNLQNPSSGMGRSGGFTSPRHHTANPSSSPTAQISMTSPRISVDIADQAGSIFSLGMNLCTQWKADEALAYRGYSLTSSSSPNQYMGPIRALTVNLNESLLASCGKSGTKLWSLNNNPIAQVTVFPNLSNAIPHSAEYLKSGLNLATCDGSVVLWDIETGKMASYLAHYPVGGGSNSSGSGGSGGGGVGSGGGQSTLSMAIHSSLNLGPPNGYNSINSSYNASSIANNSSAMNGFPSGFHSMTVISGRYGITPSIQSHGDNQILTTCNSFDIQHYDIRVSSYYSTGYNTTSSGGSGSGNLSSLTGGMSVAIKPISEWHLPSLPSLSSSSSFGVSSNSIPEHHHVNYATCDENYVLVGSNHGGIWLLDRRTGRVLNYLQAHDSPIVKLKFLDSYSFVSIAEKSAYLWSFRDCEMTKVGIVKNMPDTSSSHTPLMTNTTIIQQYDNIPSEMRGMGSGLGGGGNGGTVHVMYGIAGHKIHAGKLKSTDEFNMSSMMHNSTITPTYNEAEEIKLSQSYFYDRQRNKISKQKLSATSAVMLPLRRLLLLGTDDGNIKVVS